jgi:four helix bundle protein
MCMNTFKDLKVWQKSMNLVEKIYSLTAKFPKTELYSLVDQMRRSAISIPSNIAEGNTRQTPKDQIHFLFIAR